MSWVGWKNNWMEMFSSILCECTCGERPYEGYSQSDKLKLADVKINLNVGNTSWDYSYMKEHVGC